MNDTTWFWQIVDARGLADVSSDEFVALNELISKAERCESAEQALSAQSLSLSEARAKADAYDACVSVARNRLDHIKPEIEAELPALCEITRETWLQHKEKMPINALDMLNHAERKIAISAMTGWKLVPECATREMIDAWRMDQAQGRSLESSYRAMLGAAPALENGPADLADATSNPPLSSLSSLRKGAEDIEVTDEMIEAGKEAANGWTDRYMDGAEFVNWDEALPEIFRRMLALVSGSREEQS